MTHKPNYQEKKRSNGRQSDVCKTLCGAEEGIASCGLRQALESESENDPAKRENAADRITGPLKLLCVHGLIFKVAGRSYYRIAKRGRELMGTALKFRDSNVALLAC